LASRKSEHYASSSRTRPSASLSKYHVSYEFIVKYSLTVAMDSKLLSLVFVISVLSVAAVTTTSAAPQGDAAVLSKDDEPVDREQMKKFLSTMEKVDIDQILNNTRLMMNNIKCFLNEGPCSAQLKEMKSKCVEPTVLTALGAHEYLRAKTASDLSGTDWTCVARARSVQ